jgi:hypothetical protein
MAVEWRWIWNIVRSTLAIGIVFGYALPPRAIVPLGPQQRVESINPKIGVHTRLTDEVEEWKIKHTLELVREMGASWIVEYFPWAYYEPEKGAYSWEHADLVIAHAKRQGLKIIARIGFVPNWARPDGTSNSYLAPEHYVDLGDFVFAFAQRYRDQVDHIIIWNEPNLALEWGYRPPDPTEYTQMLRVAYARAKEANPEVRILGGALSPTLGAYDAIDDLTYLEAMYQADAADYFDILAVHAYGWRFPPDEPASPEIISFSRTELLREIMVRNGDADKPIMITEGGWNDHPRWTKAVSPSRRVAYTLQSYDLAWRQWEWCDAVALWAFRFPRPQLGYLDYFSFVTVDFTLKPIYLEVQRYAQGKDVSEWLTRD